MLHIQNKKVGFLLSIPPFLPHFIHFLFFFFFLQIIASFENHAEGIESVAFSIP